MSITSISSFDPSRISGKLGSDKVTQKDLHDIKEYLTQLTDEIRYELQHTSQVQYDIPKKLSQLENDLGYLTGTDTIAVPTKVSELENDVGYATVSQVPEKLSELENDAGFITAAEISGVEMKLLWENPNTKATFAAQTIDLTLDEYDLIGVEVVSAYNSDAQYHSSVYWIPKDGVAHYAIMLHGTGAYYFMRGFTASNTGVAITTGTRNGSSSTGYCIPAKIYGIKGVKLNADL